MNAQNDNTAPPRSGMRRLLRPVQYRHPRGFGLAHIAGGSVLAAAGLVCLSYHVYGWAAFFLVIAVLNLAAGSWYFTLDRPASART